MGIIQGPNDPGRMEKSPLDGGGGVEKQIGLPLQIAFGMSQAAIPCSNCQRMDRTGFWVIYRERGVLTCIRCIGRAIVKHQEMFPTEPIFDTDIDVDEESYQRAARAVQDKAPDMSDSRALEIARAVIETL